MPLPNTEQLVLGCLNDSYISRNIGSQDFFAGPLRGFKLHALKKDSCVSLKC